MKRVVWLASYPKSGNTWMRLMVAASASTDTATLDINGLREPFPIASSRAQFDRVTFLDSGLLTHDEVDALRPAVYAAWPADNVSPRGDDDCDTVFVKCHDAYGRTPEGRPLMAAPTVAGAIVIIRDPRSIAPSLARHWAVSIDEAIEGMADPEAALQASCDGQPPQLRQRMSSWSGHVASWLDQSDVPIHVTRYEDMKSDPEGALSRALRFAGRSLSAADVKRAVQGTDFTWLQTQERERGFRERGRRQQGLFFRRGDVDAWRHELTSAQASRIERDHGSIMLRLGYAIA